MMPMPPSRASAIASRASVTVSIAAERMGMLREISAVRRVFVATSPGSTLDAAGGSNKSSKVRPSLLNFHCQASSVVIAAPALLLQWRRWATYKKRPACDHLVASGQPAPVADVTMHTLLSRKCLQECTTRSADASKAPPASPRVHFWALAH